MSHAKSPLAVSHHQMLKLNDIFVDFDTSVLKARSEEDHKLSSNLDLQKIVRLSSFMILTSSLIRLEH